MGCMAKNGRTDASPFKFHTCGNCMLWFDRHENSNQNTSLTLLSCITHLSLLFKAFNCPPLLKRTCFLEVFAVYFLKSCLPLLVVQNRISD